MYNTYIILESLMLILTDPEEVKKRGMKLRKDPVYTTERNKEIVRAYYKKLKIEGHKDNTILGRLAIFRFILDHYHKDLDELTQQDVEDLLFELEIEKTVWGKETSKTSKALKRQSLRLALKFMFDKQIKGKTIRRYNRQNPKVASYSR